MQSKESSEERRLFTRFVQALRSDPEPEAMLFAEVWGALRDEIRRALRRRGLWHFPTAYLGVEGRDSWSQAPEALDELVADAYEFSFLKRLAHLVERVGAGQEVDGLIRRNVRNLILERQRQHDRVGTRVYNMLRQAVEEALRAGSLLQEDGEEKLSTASILRFPTASVSAAASPHGDLEDLVRPWGDGLLPELITTTGHGVPSLIGRIRVLLAELAGHGVEAFRFGDLLAALREDTRRRWAGMLAGDLGMQPGEAGDLLSFLSQQRIPGRAFEQEQSFRALVRCVEGRLKAREKADGDLWAYWKALLSWVETGEITTPDGESREPQERRGRISRREIAKILEIPRGRLSSLNRTLGDHVKRCLGAVMGRRSPAGGGGETDSSGGTAMDAKDRRGEMLRKTREAMAGLEATPPGEGLRGAVFLLPEDGEESLEWVVLGSEDARDGHLWVTPADTDPLAGSDDLSLPAGSPGGPLVLRLAAAAELPEKPFQERRPVRRVDEETVRRAVARHRRVTSKGAEEREAERLELGPDYRQLYAEVEAAVRRLQESWRPASTTSDSKAGGEATLSSLERWKEERRSRRRWQALAAVLATAVAGLAFWNLRDPADPKAVRVLPEESQIDLTQTVRGSHGIRLPAGEPEAPLYLKLLCGSVQVDFLDSTGATVESTGRLELGDRLAFSLGLSREFLATRPAEIRITTYCPGQAPVVKEKALVIYLE